MKRFTTILSIAAVLSPITGHAAPRTPAQISAAIKAVLPAGKEARCVWTRWEAASGYCKLYGVDSKDGVIFRFEAPTTGMDLYDAQITADGSRVVYFDASRQQINLSSWANNGKWQKVVATSATATKVHDYWQDPADKSDWVVCDVGNKVSRVKIDAPTNVVTLYNAEAGDDHASISLDGTHIGMFFPLSGGYSMGVAVVPSGAPVFSSNLGGCIANLSPDNTYRFMHQLSGHQAESIGRIGKPDTVVQIMDSIAAYMDRNQLTAECGLGSYFDNTRWVYPDYLTFEIRNSKVNPFLYCLSTKKFVALMDTANCDGGGLLDIWIYPPDGVSSSAPGPTLAKAGSIFVNEIAEEFTIDGRRLNPRGARGESGSSARCVALRGVNGRGTLRPVVTP